MPTYLVTGATGALGRLVVEALLRRVPASSIIAGVRDTAKAADIAAKGVTLRVLDYNRPETLGPALQGVDRVLLISGSEVGKRSAQHTAVIEAARAAGVSRLAYTSILRADTSTVGLATEHKADRRGAGEVRRAATCCCATAGIPRTSSTAYRRRCSSARCRTAPARAVSPPPPVPSTPRPMPRCSPPTACERPQVRTRRQQQLHEAGARCDPVAPVGQAGRERSLTEEG